LPLLVSALAQLGTSHLTRCDSIVKNTRLPLGFAAYREIQYLPDVLAGSFTLAEGIRDGYKTPWEKLKGQVVLGEEDFVERVKRRIKAAGSKREQPAVRRFASRDLKSVLKVVAGYFKLPEEKLTGRRTGHRDERAIAMELMYRYGGVSQSAIGKMMGDLDYTAVSRERKRLRGESPEGKRVEGGVGHRADADPPRVGDLPGVNRASALPCELRLIYDFGNDPSAPASCSLKNASSRKCPKARKD
jgi:hypothetical protein